MENMITRAIDDVSLFTNPNAMYTTMMTPAGVDSWFKKVEKIGDGLQRTANDNDILASGVNQGKSKLGTSLKQTFLPGIFNEYLEGEFSTFGFGKQMKSEFKKNEVMDSWFDSDYKKDRNAIKSQRASRKEELQEYWEKEFNLANESEDVQKVLNEKIKTLVSQELNAELPLSERYLYDENQNKIE